MTTKLMLPRYMSSAAEICRLNHDLATIRCVSSEGSKDWTPGLIPPDSILLSQRGRKTVFSCQFQRSSSQRTSRHGRPEAFLAYSLTRLRRSSFWPALLLVVDSMWKCLPLRVPDPTPALERAGRPLNLAGEPSRSSTSVRPLCFGQVKKRLLASAGSRIQRRKLCSRKCRSHRLCTCRHLACSVH